jgi:hypothetical protein
VEAPGIGRVMIRRDHDGGPRRMQAGWYH